MEGEKRASCKSEAQPAEGACIIRPGTIGGTVGDPGWPAPGAVLRQGLLENAGEHPGTAVLKAPRVCVEHPSFQNVFSF